MTGKELVAFRGPCRGDQRHRFLSRRHARRLRQRGRAPALVWDVSKLQRRAAVTKALQPGELEKCWKALAGDDAAKAFDANPRFDRRPATGG